jgi:hypothetical protein
MRTRQAIVAISIASALFVAPSGYGRIGEGYRQCVERYGKAIAALPGLEHALGVAGFEKSGIAVTAFFDRSTRQCFLILYTRTNAGHIMEDASLTEAQIDSLMASLNVSWVSTDDDDQSSRRSAMSANKVGFNKTPTWKKNLDLAQSAAKAFTDALERGRSAHINAKDEKCQAIFDSLPLYGLRLNSYRRSGDNLFAFTVHGGLGARQGLLLINSDAASAISNWAEAYKESLKQTKEKGRPLEGF